MKASIRVNVSRLPDVGVKAKPIPHTEENRMPFEFRSPHENDSELKSQPEFEEVDTSDEEESVEEEEA